MQTISLIFYAFRDLVLPYLPVSKKQKISYRYGFLIHPRDDRDVLSRYPFLSFLPESLMQFFTLHFWPIIVTKVKGLRTADNEPIEGYILAISLTARQIIEHRERAVKKIKKSLYLAQRFGIKIVALGALTSSVTKGGLDLLDVKDVSITTGHAYTGYNVTQNLFKLMEIFDSKPERVKVAIVGAAGSIGSISAQILARAGYTDLLLVDLERKKHLIHELMKEIHTLNPTVSVRISHHIGDVKESDFIIAATNAPEALIKSDDLKSGAVVIDDAQPSDVHKDVLMRGDVLAIEAGVVHTPGIKSMFSLGLKSQFDNFCCMAEVLILAAHKWSSHFVLNRANLEHVDQIAEWGKELGFQVAGFQNRLEAISSEKLERVKKLHQKNQT